MTLNNKTVLIVLNIGLLWSSTSADSLRLKNTSITKTVTNKITVSKTLYSSRTASTQNYTHITRSSTHPKQSPRELKQDGDNLSVVCTAFCACVKCCSTNAIGITASGSKPIEGITIAASRKYPFGTRVALTVPYAFTNRVFEVQDRLHIKYDKRVDVFINNHQRAKEFGKNKGTMRIISK